MWLVRSKSSNATWSFCHGNSYHCSQSLLLSGLTATLFLLLDLSVEATRWLYTDTGSPFERPTNPPRYSGTDPKHRHWPSQVGSQLPVKWSLNGLGTMPADAPLHFTCLWTHEWSLGLDMTWPITLFSNGGWNGKSAEWQIYWTR